MSARYTPGGFHPSSDGLSIDHEIDPRCFVRPDGGASAPSASRRETLTARECEVALLLTAQISNREIGRRLSISERTVEHHVQSVLGRLGLRSRFQVTAAILGQQGCSSPRTSD